MGFLGYLDEAGPYVLHGWAYLTFVPGLRVLVDVVIDRRMVARVQAAAYRHDLLAAGMGDGHCAFYMNPLEFLQPRNNIIELYFSGTDQLLTNGHREIRGPSADAQLTSVKVAAEARWKGDESDCSLTWGRMMTGDSFVSEVERRFQFRDDTRIIEIGPGYGRLLEAILRAEKPFQKFVGIDLSEPRVCKLRERFGARKAIYFETGNCDTFTFEDTFDLVISSATFEHLYPSVQRTLANLYACLNPGGMAFIDFIHQDDELATSKAYFESEAEGAYIRIYSRAELERFFAAEGFVVREIVHPLVLGTGIHGNEIRRILVVAEKEP